MTVHGAQVLLDFFIFFDLSDIFRRETIESTFFYLRATTRLLHADPPVPRDGPSWCLIYCCHRYPRLLCRCLLLELFVVVLRFACRHHLWVRTIPMVVLFKDSVEQKLAFIATDFHCFLVVVVVEKFQIGNTVFHRYVNTVLSHGMEPQHFINENVHQRFSAGR